MLDTFVALMQALARSRASLRRFRHLLFGPRTERSRELLKPERGNVAGPRAERASTAEREHPVAGAEHSGVLPPRPGHGRNGAQAYPGASLIEVQHPGLRSGDRCAQCPTGKLYTYEPRVLVRWIGQAPLAVHIYRLERLRCRMCDAVVSAPLPEGVGADKYEESCASMIALLKYGSGMPFFRLQGLQANLRLPLPDATQWEIVARAASAPRLIYQELIRQAAQAPLLHNDDTPAKILALRGEHARSAPADALAAGALYRFPRARRLSESHGQENSQAGAFALRVGPR